MNCSKCNHSMMQHDRGGCHHVVRQVTGSFDLVCKCSLQPHAIAEMEVESLRAQLAEAREAVKPLADLFAEVKYRIDTPFNNYVACSMNVKDLERAAAYLKKYPK